jgi:hypothetical protein
VVTGFAFQVFGGAAASQAIALAVGKSGVPLAGSLFARTPLNLVPLAESYIVQECYPLHDINYTQDVSQIGTSGVLKNDGPLDLLLRSQMETFGRTSMIYLY